MTTIKDIINKEANEANDAGMIVAGCLEDFQNGTLSLGEDLFVYSAWGFRKIQYLTGGGYDIVTGDGNFWDQRTFMCHGGTRIYKKEDAQ